MGYKKELIAAFKDDRLLEALRELTSRDPRKRNEIGHDLAELHEAGTIDIPEAFSNVEERGVREPSFLDVRRFFEDVLPRITVPVDSVLRTIQSLYGDGKGELNAIRVLSSFAKFLGRSEDRPLQALEEIQANLSSLKELLLVTLSSGSSFDPRFYLSKAVEFSRAEDADVRVIGLKSLSRLKGDWSYGDDSLVLETLEETVVSSKDDRTLSALVEVALELLSRAQAGQEKLGLVITNALEAGGRETLRSASYFFAYSGKDIPSRVLSVVLLHFRCMDLGDADAIEAMDYGISRFLKGENQDLVVDFLHELITKESQLVDLAVLAEAARAIQELSALRNKLVTRWLLDGNQRLCRQVEHLVDSHDLEMDADEVGASSTPALSSAARRIVGYLFAKPLRATSLLLSILRQYPDSQVREEIVKLLTNPLLLNYGSVGEHLEKIKGSESAVVREAIQESLGIARKYFDDLESIGEIKAFHPSLRSREIYSHQYSEVMSEAIENAHDESVFAQITHRTTLLYGRKLLYKQFDSNRQGARMESHLRDHSIHLEVPRMSRLDPVGLGLMLSQFRLG